MIQGNDDKRIFNFSIESRYNYDTNFHYRYEYYVRYFLDAITQLEPVQIQKDPLLQIQLVKASPELGHYSLLIKFVAFQIILVDLGVKLKSKEYKSQVNSFFFI